MRFLASWWVLCASVGAGAMFGTGVTGTAVTMAIAAAVGLAFLVPGSVTAYKRRVGLLGVTALLVLGALPLYFSRVDVAAMFALPVAFALMGAVLWPSLRGWSDIKLKWSTSVARMDEVGRRYESLTELAAALSDEPAPDDLAADERFRREHAVAMDELNQPLRAYEGFLGAIRGIGPAVLALGFLLFWVTAYSVLWFIDPTECTQDACHGAFQGLDEEPLFGDFVYMAVSGVVGSTPPGIVPATAVAKMLSAAQFLSAALLLGAYAAAIFSRAPVLPNQPRP